MKKLMGICLFAIVLAGPSVVPVLPASFAQDQDRDRDRRDQDERGYYNNRYYRQGWKDGQHHKHKHRKWKNDDDRRAYEAGYAHGEHGDRWSQHDRDDHR
jgi:hypothetical protein